MLNSFLIALREGFEIFLILALTISYLEKSNREWLKSAVYWGFGISVAVSAYLGVRILEATINQPLWEGLLCLVAVVLVISLLYHMRKHAPKMKQEIQDKIESTDIKGQSKVKSYLGVLAFVILMTIREGMETAFMMLSIYETPNMLLGTILGLLGAGTLGFVWVKFGHLVNLKRFFQVTTIFLIMFICQLIVYAIHEFSEAGLFGASSEAIHLATEPFSPVGYIGQWFSSAIVGICIVFLFISWVANKGIKKNDVAMANLKQ